MQFKILFTFTLIFFISNSALAKAPQYHFLREIPIEHKEGGWDYLNIDEFSRRLYMSQKSRVVVVDIDQNKVIGEIKDTPGVHGFAFAPELNLGFSSNGKDSTLSKVDLKTFKTLLKITTGENPDAILYNPTKQEVYTFNGLGKSASVIDVKTGKIITISLPGKPEFAGFDSKKNKVFVNIEDKNLLIVIDSNSHKILNEWPLTDCKEPTGMAIDHKNHHLFSACRNQLILMLDMNSGKILARAPIGKAVDAVSFDPSMNLVFTSNGDGTVSILQSSKKLELIQTLKTELGARTMALDLKTHQIFLPSARFEKATNQSTSKRPQIIPGTLKLLVYGI